MKQRRSTSIKLQTKQTLRAAFFQPSGNFGLGVPGLPEEKERAQRERTPAIICNLFPETQRRDRADAGCHGMVAWRGEIPSRSLKTLTGLVISTFPHFLFIFFDFDTCPHSTMSTFHVFDTFCLTEIVTEEAGDGHQDPLRHEEGGRFSKRFKDFL